MTLINLSVPVDGKLCKGADWYLQKGNQMTKDTYVDIENFMLTQMKDSAHDKHHVYRVLNFALDIYGHEKDVNFDVLVAACLLHDVGREKQFADLGKLCHAQIGSEMAYDFLISRKWKEEKATHVKECISSHRYRGNNVPTSIEAKILFDADKLDVSGAIGIARTLLYEGHVADPFYIMDDDGHIIVDKGGAERSSFFQEYNFKLKKIYNSFYTSRAKAVALEAQKTAIDFYNGLFNEVTKNYENGMKKHMIFDENKNVKEISHG